MLVKGLLGAALAFGILGFPGRLLADALDAATPLPPELKPAFETPSEFANQFGEYQSPLIFQDGAPVKSAADWPKRREEIRRQWQEIMGPWPPLIENPRLVILDRGQRENFVQCRIEIEIAPGHISRGYLLLPEGKPKFPAVFVPYYDAETSVGLGKELARFCLSTDKEGIRHAFHRLSGR